jgi:DNA-binding NarL/FixJ family response regulator
LANNDIAGRLFVSPRAVQTRPTHVYSKLGLAAACSLSKKQPTTVKCGSPVKGNR